MDDKVILKDFIYLWSYQLPIFNFNSIFNANFSNLFIVFKLNFYCLKINLICYNSLIPLLPQKLTANLRSI